MTSRILSALDQHMLELPEMDPHARGYATITREALRRVWVDQGGWTDNVRHPILLSNSYILVKKDYLFKALKQYHDFQVAVTGMPPQELYKEGVFVCREFAQHFMMFLSLCHRRHWSKSIGNHKIALGWACNSKAEGNWRIPDNHALIVNVFQRKDGSYGIELWEPYLESIYAKYGGEADCSQFYIAEWS